MPPRHRHLIDPDKPSLPASTRTAVESSSSGHVQAHSRLADRRYKFFCPRKGTGTSSDGAVSASASALPPAFLFSDKPHRYLSAHPSRDHRASPWSSAGSTGQSSTAHESTSTGTAFTIPHTTTTLRGCRAKNHRVEEAEVDPCITLIFFQPLSSSYAPSSAREKCVTACLQPATFKITTLR